MNTQLPEPSATATAKAWVEVAASAFAYIDAHPFAALTVLAAGWLAWKIVAELKSRPPRPTRKARP